MHFGFLALLFLVHSFKSVLSLYVTRLIKLVNKKDKLKSSLNFDEFPTIYLNISEMSRQTDVIMNITGNINSGQVTGDTAKQLSEPFGKIMQNGTRFSINRMDNSVSKSRQLDSAIPPSKISALSPGEFVGLVADNPEQRIDLKAFNCEILNDHQALRKQQDGYQAIPEIRKSEKSISRL